MGFEIEKRLLQPWEKISFQEGGLVQRATPEMLEMTAGVDTSAIEDRVSDFALLGVAEGWSDYMQEQVTAAYVQYEEELNDDDPIHQQIIDFVFEWGLNWMLPGMGTILMGLYEWNEDMNALDNYEAALTAIQENYEGTFLEEYANSAVDVLTGVAKQISNTHLTSTVLGLVVPQALKGLAEWGMDFIKEHGLDEWFSKATEAEMATGSSAAEAVEVGVTMDDMSEVIDEVSSNPEMYSQLSNYDFNMDGIIDSLDEMALNQELLTGVSEEIIDIGGGTFLGDISPFEKGAKEGPTDIVYSEEDLVNMVENPEEFVNTTDWTLEEIDQIVTGDPNAPVQLENLGLEKPSHDMFQPDMTYGEIRDEYLPDNIPPNMSIADAQQMFDENFSQDINMFAETRKMAQDIITEEGISWEEFFQDPKNNWFKDYDYNLDGMITFEDMSGVAPETLNAFEAARGVISPIPGMQGESLYLKDFSNFMEGLESAGARIPEAPPSIFEEWTGSPSVQAVTGGIDKITSNIPGFKTLTKPLDLLTGGGWLNPYWAQYGLGQMPGTGQTFGYTDYDYWGNPTFTQIPGAYNAPTPSVNPQLLQTIWNTPDYG